MADPNRLGRPLGKDNKDDAKNLIENESEILKIRGDIINAYKKLKTEKIPDLIDLEQNEEEEEEEEAKKEKEAKEIEKPEYKNVNLDWIHGTKDMLEEFKKMQIIFLIECSSNIFKKVFVMSILKILKIFYKIYC